MSGITYLTSNKIMNGTSTRKMEYFLPLLGKTVMRAIRKDTIRKIGMATEIGPRKS
jgi:hypothetical protein